MPLFEYFCNDDSHHDGCGHTFEEHHSIDDRMIPMNKPCPECGKEDNICRKFSAHLHHGVMTPKKKMDENFKSTMERIHKEHPAAQSSYF